jgi:Nickel responsive protein SCO4226-like
VETGFYLVERYLPGASGDDVAAAAARVQAAAEQLTAEGVSIRYLGGTFIPADETFFCEFEAPSEDVVEWANERANVPYARILPAIPLSARRPRRRSA